MSARAAAATLPVALHALTGHMLAHRLPVPRSIDTCGSVDGSRRLLIWLHTDDADRWQRAEFTESARRSQPNQDGSSWQRVEVDGAITVPIGDVAVRLIFVTPSAGRIGQLAGITA